MRGSTQLSLRIVFPGRPDYYTVCVDPTLVQNKEKTSWNLGTINEDTR